MRARGCGPPLQRVVQVQRPSLLGRDCSTAAGAAVVVVLVLLVLARWVLR